MRVGVLATVVWCCLAMAALSTSARVPAPPAATVESASPSSAASEHPTFRQTLWWFDAMHLRRVQRHVTGRGVRVAVIDNALDPSVPELRGQHVRERGACGRGVSRPVPDVAESFHGTSMAALIVGSGRGDGPGGRGVPGIAPDARLLFYGVDAHPRTHRLDCSSAGVAQLVDAALRDGADIISMSLVMMSSGRFESSISRALDAGVVVVAAIGNRGDRFDYSYPAWYPGVVAVGGVDSRLRPWRGAPRDDSTTVVAPAARVSSGGASPDGGWTSLYWASGTSVATAITSGALALVKSKYPGATGNQLIQHLIHTAGDGRGFDWRRGYGFGRVDVRRMLASSPAQWPDENPVMLPTERAVDNYPTWTSSLVEDPSSGRERDGGTDVTTGQKVTSVWMWPGDNDPPDVTSSGFGVVVGRLARGPWPWSALGLGLFAAAVLARRMRR